VARARSFPPVVGASPKVLILGSMPGVESLRQGKYYAHPRNQFWKLLGEVLGEPLQESAYERRLDILKKRGIALWDVLESCVREGSLDSDICDEEPNEIADLLRETGIKTVFCNGGKSYAAFRALIADALPSGVEFHKLPSSSPAAAALTFHEKLRSWGVIAERLRRS
jgi:hypoxanthine-DNA glycosylase